MCYRLLWEVEHRTDVSNQGRTILEPESEHEPFVDSKHDKCKDKENFEARVTCEAQNQGLDMTLGREQSLGR